MIAIVIGTKIQQTSSLTVLVDVFYFTDDHKTLLILFQ